jgi:hypothetical protein
MGLRDGGCAPVSDFKGRHFEGEIVLWAVQGGFGLAVEAALERRERARAGGELAATRGVPFRMPVENAQEFTLASWRPMIERSLGREVVGLVTDSGISWQIGVSIRREPRGMY